MDKLLGPVDIADFQGDGDDIIVSEMRKLAVFQQQAGIQGRLVQVECLPEIGAFQLVDFSDTKIKGQ